jgi:membrane-bound serine protease (ClpP class)
LLVRTLLTLAAFMAIGDVGAPAFAVVSSSDSRPDSAPTSEPETAPTSEPDTAVVESDERPAGPFVEIIEVAGWIDPVLSEFLIQKIEGAERDNAQAAVLQVNSPGSLLSADDLQRLTDRLSASELPIAAWVGPSGARARGGAVDLLGAADIVGVAGKIEVQPAGAEPMDSEQAVDNEFADISAPVLADFIGQLDGRSVAGKTLETAEDAEAQEDGRELAKLRTVRFQQLGLVQQLLHNMTSPAIVFLMLAIGLALAIFEFYTGGVGIAAGVAVVCGGLGAYGLGVLPTRPFAAVLIVGAFLAFAIDVQAGQPRFWTGVGAVSLAVGSRLLFRDGVSVPLWWAAIVIGMVIVFMVGGMPTMIRTRFATPTIGRESMIGSVGTANTDVAPDGVVSVMGAPWRARTNRATPISAGSELRVAAIDGLVLEVEPLEGAAKDHRDRR